MKRLHACLAALIAVSVSACTSPVEPAQRSNMSNSCIDGSRIREHKAISNQEIQFTLAGGEVWSNRLPRACPGLRAQGGFSWDVSHTICSGLQTIYVLESGIPCQLGEFSRVTPAGAPG